jgi:aldehyde:ferredoxin oxidoreductase
VRYAAIVNQLKHFHGRCGLGAVMGAKRLKAIVVGGSKPPGATDKESAKRQLVWFREHYDRSKDRFHQLGSSSGVLALEASGILPTRNFATGRSRARGPSAARRCATPFWSTAARATRARWPASARSR